ncbi:MAG: hypothetical protein COU07_02355 [Candidatus Harrisonbacteria bacterium CG10_big_fil_rev_8_21_14_0_10_40_38]|uniref:Uncharacterized protein n=1 Tax=Candidatus Harrisonbacteria bacterium CG10_big_fil_rev_8_21_14_0_10_40_38 TaxID=1974583 RepID=A0A2H0URZ9_9BACT|nr:MAG: hypothetical protein COU07_02355 [Candidatus Harrisonbacteria bacterium CG10_big_fil_rev_8_21_14_0_10_40_38]
MNISASSFLFGYYLPFGLYTNLNNLQTNSRRPQNANGGVPADEIPVKTFEPICALGVIHG